MIRFACPSCAAVFTTTDDKGGKTGTCSKCQTQFIVPEAVAPPPLATPSKPTSGAAPVAKVIRSEPPPVERKKSLLDDDEDDRPRRSRLQENDDDDRPRRRSSSLKDDDDDDRPRRRPANRRDDDNDDYDRPRRRTRRDDDDDDYDRPRKMKKSKPRSGMILACGIVCLVAAVGMLIVAIIDTDNISGRSRFGGGFGSGGTRPSLPTQIEIFLVCYQISIYGSLLTALVMIPGGIGLILYQIWGRTTMLAAAGLSAFMIVNILLYALLILTYSPGKGQLVATPSSSVIFGYLLRLVVHVVPVVFVAITLFNIRHTKSLRNGFN